MIVMPDTRIEFRTRFHGPPMQIVVGLESALESLNGNPIESVEVRVIGGGDSVPLHTYGPVGFPQGADKECFYRECQSAVLQEYQIGPR